jgi:2-(1,2-epoxy-1,2-dihydrophenyl)acetyl-CoA isomerase
VTDEAFPTTGVQTARRLYQALAAGDRGALAEILTPGFVGQTAAGLPLGLGGSYASAESMQRDFWWRLGRAFRVRAEPESFDRLGDDRLQVSGTYRGSARSTGRPLEAAFVHVLSFDGGRISALVQLTDTAAWHAALDGEPVPDGRPASELPPYQHPGIEDLRAIEYDVTGHVATVRLNRPEHRNAIDLRMAEETLTVARSIAADPAVRAVLISGHGPALSVGGDIEYLRQAPVGTLGTLAAYMTDPFHEAFRILSGVDAPIVTAAHGSVAGGGLGYVYAADVVLAAEGTVFSTAFSGLGISGDGGGTWHLPRIVGTARARRMYIENLRLDAARALEWGLVAEVVPAGELAQRARALADRLAAGPTRAYGLQRRLLRDSWGATLSDQLRAESDGVAVSGNTRDADAAVQAFLDRRPSTFEGR